MELYNWDKTTSREDLGLWEDPRFSQRVSASNNYEKNEDALRTGNGICYTDRNGRHYTRADIEHLVRTDDDDTVMKAFACLKGDAPEKELESFGSHFVKCKRCGAYIPDERNIRKRKEMCFCPACRPVRTHGVLPLTKDPYDDERRFFKKTKTAFKPGITTLVGCNGAGKTTLLKDIIRTLDERGVPYIDFDNLSNGEGGESLWRTMMDESLMGFGGGQDQLGSAVMLMSSSEGERIGYSLVQTFRKLHERMKKMQGYGEMWVLMDAVDSGLSADIIEDVKQYLFEPLIREIKMPVYLIVSSNSWEMSEGTMCYSVHNQSYLRVSSYQGYKKAVLKSREEKELRDDIFQKKIEILKRPQEFEADHDYLRSLREYRAGGRDRKDRQKKEVACLTIGDWRAKCFAKKDDRGWHDISTRFVAERKKDGVWTRVNIPERYRPEDFDILRDSTKETLADILANMIYRYEAR